MKCKYNKDLDCDPMECELEFCSRLFKEGGKYFHLTGLEGNI